MLTKSSIPVTHTIEAPLVSIVTVTFNSEKTIDHTITSILNQTYSRIQHIIIDGLSTDKTLLIINNFKEKYKQKNYQLNLISEKDSGIYDAMNKGISLAVGDYISILNSDDFYFNGNVIQDVVKIMSESKSEFLYGDIQFVDPKNPKLVKRVWKAGRGNFLNGWNPPHPSTFVSKSIYNQLGSFDSNFRISSDYDFMFRVLHKNKVSSIYLDRVLVSMRLGGKSTKNLRNHLLGSQEIITILKRNGIFFPLFIVLLRIIRKLGQIF
jgi:glycosyltransferase involved in cell wall biosynthesis